MSQFAQRIRPFVQAEILAAKACASRGDFVQGFWHLERAHVLGQASTREHVRVHWCMLLWALRRQEWANIPGQVFRIVAASTLTVLGLVPHGNTGGSNVNPLLPMSIPSDLAELIAAARRSDDVHLSDRTH